jgi:hypothetical protein
MTRYVLTAMCFIWNFTLCFAGSNSIHRSMDPSHAKLWEQESNELHWIWSRILDVDGVESVSNVRENTTSGTNTLIKVEVRTANAAKILRKIFKNHTGIPIYIDGDEVPLGKPSCDSTLR